MKTLLLNDAKVEPDAGTTASGCDPHGLLHDYPIRVLCQIHQPFFAADPIYDLYSTKVIKSRQNCDITL